MCVTQRRRDGGSEIAGDDVAVVKQQQCLLLGMCKGFTVEFVKGSKRSRAGRGLQNLCVGFVRLERIFRSLSEHSLSELPSRAQSESTRKTLAFSEAVLSE
ncbi:hypothetical protein Tco_1230218 [Tanacetum coccineum]